MESKVILALFVFVLRFSVVLGSFLPSVVWDPRNVLFGCDGITIKVQEDDFLSFLCPSDENNLKIGFRPYLIKIYLVEGKEQFDNCNSTGGKFVMNCIDGNKILFRRLKFYTPDTDPGSIEFIFDKGKTYYFLSTSTGDSAGIDNRINGSCSPTNTKAFPLKLPVYVCTKDDIDSGNCKQGDYLKGCARWDMWKPSSKFFWNGTKCLQRFTRTCLTDNFVCEGSTEKYLEASSNDNCTLYKYCPSSSFSFIPASTSSLATCPTKTVSKTVVMLTTKTCAPSVSVSVSVSVMPTTVTQTVTSIQGTAIASVRTVTTTKVTTSTSTTVQTVTQTVTEKCGTSSPVMQKVYQDISYDSKYYITVVAAIVGAILVAVFVGHACVSYWKEKRVSNRVIKVAEYNPSPADSGNSSKATVTGTYSYKKISDV